MAEGREGDWECNSCRNRNYAFRSFCNRCKQPRLLVDTKTPADSKWLPRIGDWICSGCTNNNYASREKCKKCGQPKEVAAMPAIAIPGGSVPSYAHYFARAQAGSQQKMNIGLINNPSVQYGSQLASNWPLGGNSSSILPYPNQANQLPSAPEGWRSGDWICTCGFHNYSSRAQCKKCNLSRQPAVGTKRLASEEFVHDWDNKRLNAGHSSAQQLYLGYEQIPGANSDQNVRTYPHFAVGSSAVAPNVQMNVQMPQLTPMPTLLGKGAKQWRDGDWMCTNCNNHNYASRSQCNKCKTQRDTPTQQVSVA